MDDAERHAWVTLTLVPGLGPKLTQALLERFGSARAAIQATEQELLAVPNIGEKTARQFLNAIQSVDAKAEIEKAHALGVQILPRVDPNYPATLLTLSDVPPLLYVKGAFQPTDSKAIGIVGSRSCTSYGKRVARQMAASLARAGYTIISGLALGIDGEAHQGALEAGGRTLAILAGGLSKIYPPQHVQLAEQVCQHGALITESPMAMAPQAGMFHSRNRIISGLSMAVVIIEANTQSGSLITARHASEQGREVFVIPANVDSPASAGSLKLLRDGARLIRGVDDLLEDLQGIKPAQVPMPLALPTPREEQTAPAKPAPVLEGNSQLLWDFLTEARHTDEIARHLNKAVSELSGLLLQLEMKRVIRRLPGNFYERRA